MPRSVTGDELDRIGGLGENEFQNLCIRARLHCSKVHPDKTGKDFIVEFPLSAPLHSVPFDKAPPPVQVVVQVKTILSKTTSAKLALSVASRLAKDTRPAVVAIMRIDENDDFQGLHIVHLLDDELGRILKSLRKASKKGSSKLHEMSISFGPNAANRISMDPLQLHATLAALAAPDMLTYAARKSGQLHSLGFDADRFRMKFAVTGTDEELVDGLLALKPLKVHDVVMTERRFDLDLPIQGLSRATVEFQPKANMTGEVLVRCTADGVKTNLDIPAEFRYVPESILGEGNAALRASTRIGEFIIKQKRWTYSHPNDFGPDDRQSLEDWIDYLDLCCMIGSGKFNLELIGKGEIGRLTYRVSDASVVFDTKTEASYLKLLHRLKTVHSAARLSATTFRLEELRLAAERISLVADSLERPAYHFECSHPGGEFPLFAKEPAALLSAVDVMGHWIGFVLPITASAASSSEGILCKGVQSKKAIVEALDTDNLDQDFDVFRRKYCDLLDVRIAFIQDPGQFNEGTTVLEDRRDEYEGNSAPADTRSAT